MSTFTYTLGFCRLGGWLVSFKMSCKQHDGHVGTLDPWKFWAKRLQMKANQQKYKCYINNICIFMCTVYIYI